jgi:hypothetical protein
MSVLDAKRVFRVPNCLLLSSHSLSKTNTGFAAPISTGRVTQIGQKQVPSGSRFREEKTLLLLRSHKAAAQLTA